MLYQKPEMDILNFDEKDVVITSLTGSGFNDEKQEGGDSTGTGRYEW